MPSVRAFLLLLVLLAPTASADAADYAPALAVVIPTTEASTSAGDVLLAWMPGEQIADTYRLYGLAPGAKRTLLGVLTITDAKSAAGAVVPSGYASYAVSGVVGEVESPMITAAVVGSGAPCATIHPSEFYVRIRCLPVVVQRPSMSAIE